MKRRPPRPNRPDTLLPSTPLFRSHGVGLRRDDRLVWNPHRDVIPVRLRLRGLAPGLSPDPYRDAVARHLRALGEVRDDLVRLSLRRQGTVTGRHEDADLEYSEVMVAVRGPDARRLRLRRQDGR